MTLAAAPVCSGTKLLHRWRASGATAATALTSPAGVLLGPLLLRVLLMLLQRLWGSWWVATCKGLASIRWAFLAFYST